MTRVEFKLKRFNTNENLCKTKEISYTILILCALSVLLNTQMSYGQWDLSPLEKHLNTDGTLNTSLDFSGSLDTKGWNMDFDPKTNEPKFYRISDDPRVITWNNVGGTALTNDYVYTLAVNNSGNVYAGGPFTTIVGVPANHIAKWNGSSWSNLGTGVSGGLGTVWAIAVTGNDVYVGGAFSNAGGVSANHIAKWNGSTWSALGIGVNIYVYANAVSGSDVYVGGPFTTAGGNPANHIAKWNGSSWSALGSGVNGSWVHAIVLSGSDVYVGGQFTTAGGVPANRIAKWNGSSWSALGSGVGSVIGDYVYTIEVNGSDVYVGGNFTTAGGNPANYIAKWNGSTWTNLGSGVNNRVYAIAVSGSDVYVGGYFLYAGGNSTNRIANWNGSSWSALGSGMNSDVFGLKIRPAERVMYVVGDFDYAGGITASRVARFSDSENPFAPPPPPILVSPVNGAILVATNPLLDWNSSATAESYRIQVSTSSGFTSTVYNVSNITVTEYQIPNNGLNINTTYYWRVNAKNVVGTSPYSTIFHFTTGATNISGNNEIPKEFRLYSNYPNPFNLETKIRFDIPKQGQVRLNVYDILGRVVATLVNEELNAGRYEVVWPAPTGDGTGFPSGVYFYTLQSGDFKETKKMLLLK